MTGMKKTAIIFTCTVLAFSLSISNGAYGEEAKEPAVPEAQLIDANAALNENHPAIEEGVTCNDCHELKLDARTTATEAWLTGDYLKWKAGEGIMPKEKVWDRVVEIFRQKGFKRTMVLATSMNNKPATTTAEFALDTKRQVLYGLHEKSTAKLMHIKNNPYVSLNWHREFDDNFANTLCIQAVGRAEILDASAKEFEEGLSVYPYQYGAAARKLTVEGWKAIIKKEMAMTKITIEQIVLVDGGLAGTEFRTSQRWMRK
jgi:general stress protein 26